MAYSLKLWSSRVMIFVLYCLIKCFSFRPKRERVNRRFRVLLTGTFHAKNWVEAHVVPLAQAPCVESVTLVALDWSYDIPGITVVEPSKNLQKVVGGTLGRLTTFLVYVFRLKPDYIGGFHLLFNGLFSILLASALGRRSLYFSVGGITETLVTGETENRYFKFIRGKDEFLTTYICKIISHADHVITMGEGAKRFFSEVGVDENRITVISGAIDGRKFHSDVVEREYDIVLVGRLAPIKQIDIFVNTVKHIVEQDTDVRALVVGDGMLKEELVELSKQLGVADNIHFVGHQDDVVSWLNRCKIFVLTSKSEGLSLSMLEALSCGLPAIVPNVGDLADVLRDGYNGYLVESHSVKDFADRIMFLMADQEEYGELSTNAIESVRRFDLAHVTAQWDRLLS